MFEIRIPCIPLQPENELQLISCEFSEPRLIRPKQKKEYQPPASMRNSKHEWEHLPFLPCDPTIVMDLRITCATVSLQSSSGHRRGLSSLPVFQYIEAWKQVLQQQQAAEEDVDCGAQTA
jgi:hypothetical protein